MLLKYFSSTLTYSASLETVRANLSFGNEAKQWTKRNREIRSLNILKSSQTLRKLLHYGFILLLQFNNEWQTALWGSTQWHSWKLYMVKRKHIIPQYHKLKLIKSNKFYFILIFFIWFTSHSSHRITTSHEHNIHTRLADTKYLFTWWLINISSLHFIKINRKHKLFIISNHNSKNTSLYTIFLE